MNIKKSVAIGTALLVTMLAVPAPPAQATAVTTPLSVTAIVGAVGSLSTSAVSFGSYDPIVANTSTALNANGSISDTCSNGLAGTITLDAGLYATGSSTASVPARQMRSGPSVLAYFLYTDSARTNPWGSHRRRNHRHRLNLGTRVGVRPDSGPAERRGRLLRRHGNRNNNLLTEANGTAATKIRPTDR